MDAFTLPPELAEFALDVVLEDYLVPQASFTELLFVGEALLTKVTADAAPHELAVRDKLESLVLYGQDVKRHNDAVEVRRKLRVKTARVEVVTTLTTVAGILDALARARLPAVAEEGRSLQQLLLGELRDPMRASVRGLHAHLRRVEETLADPQVRARVVARVPELLLTQLSAGYQRLGRELGIVTGPPDELDAGPLDEGPARARLARCIERLVYLYMGAADPDEPQTLARTWMTLRPLAELRIERSRRRRRRARARKAE